MRALIRIKRKAWCLRRSARGQAVGLLLLLIPAALSAQQLSVSSAVAPRGGRVTLELTLKSPAQKEPIALQWEASIPSGQLSFIDKDPAPGPALRVSDKSVNCTVKLTKSPDTFTYMCIASGGLKAIPDGVFARLNLRISPEARIGPQPVRVKGIAISKDLTETPLNSVEAAVTVRTE